MGATKVNFQDVRAIRTADILIEGFELLKHKRCKIICKNLLAKGETILVKASFLNACVGVDEEGNPDEGNILYRRRVVPFVSKIKECRELKKGRRNALYVDIESISEADCKYLYKKMGNKSAKSNDVLEIEAKKITFAL